MYMALSMNVYQCISGSLPLNRAAILQLLVPLHQVEGSQLFPGPGRCSREAPDTGIVHTDNSGIRCSRCLPVGLSLSQPLL